MKFVTESGSAYELTDVEETPEGGYMATLTREGVPLVEFGTGREMEDMPTQTVYFANPPEVGERFRYGTGTHGWAVSTPVAEVAA
ncbi:MAG: hypothetical protein ACXVGB_00095 [Mycobacteriaceae bacterium]